MSMRKISRFALLKIWGRYRLGERRSDMAKEFNVSRNLIYNHMRRIDRTMKHPRPDFLENYCHFEKPHAISLAQEGRLPEGFGHLDPANDKQMGTILPLELFHRIEAKVDGVVFRNRSQIVRTALIEWLDRDQASEKELDTERIRKADRVLKEALRHWLKAHSPEWSV